MPMAVDVWVGNHDEDNRRRVTLPPGSLELTLGTGKSLQVSDRSGGEKEKEKEKKAEKETETEKKETGKEEKVEEQVNPVGGKSVVGLQVEDEDVDEEEDEGWEERWKTRSSAISNNIFPLQGWSSSTLGGSTDRDRDREGGAARGVVRSRPLTSPSAVQAAKQGEWLDPRRCCLCHDGDEDAVCGRLLAYSDGYYAHVNCVRWSAEVRIERGGD